VRVTATSVHDPAIEATARVSLIAARPLFVVARPVSSAGVAATTAFATAAPLAVRVAPVVIDVTPAAGARGDTVHVTVTGAGLDGATRLEFLAGTTADPALAVTGLAISPDGREARADIAIAADAGLGPRVVRVVTPTGSSGAAGLGDNVFTVR
jgi:hypothetical protein